MTDERALRRAPVATVLLHWGMVLALAVSLATGFRIAADAPDARFTRALAPWLPQGDVLLWHLVSGASILGLALAYGLYQGLSGLGRRLLPGRLAPGGARGYRFRVHLVLYWSLFGLVGLATLTGLLQYLGAHAIPLAPLAAVHRAAAFGLLAYLALHVAAHMAAGGARALLPIFLPRPQFARVGAFAAAGAAVAVLALIAADRVLPRTLEVTWADVAPVLDGRVEDPAWQGAPAASLRLGKGANLAGGETRVAVRAVHDGERLYLLCQWTDPTRSQKHVPLRKTAEGWQIMQTAYRQADENRFYEDKLALLLARSDPLAAVASIHLGHRPLAGQPGAAGGRGLHYTTDGGILDLWHWKSVRNAAHRQADDNFFGPPLPAPESSPRYRDPDSGAWFPRYTAGYRKDPPATFSGYEMNWEYFSEGPMRPLRLPDDARDLAQLGPLDLSPDRSDQGQWWIEFNDMRPYAQGRDDLPLGTLLPSVLPTGRLTGDRGDLKARGHWADGRWHLELSRRLDTGSARDVPIADGTFLWVAVFDHSQTRHAYHLRPLRIRLAKAPPAGGAVDAAKPGAEQPR